MTTGLNNLVMCFAEEKGFFRAQSADCSVFLFLLHCFCIKCFISASLEALSVASSPEIAEN